MTNTISELVGLQPTAPRAVDFRRYRIAATGNIDCSYLIVSLTRYSLEK